MGKKLASKVNKSVVENEKKKSVDIFERIKLILVGENKNVEWLAYQIGLKNKSSLYVAFKKGSITIDQLDKIAKILSVPISLFFEDDVIERLVESVVKRPENPDLKGFLMGFSRDVAKGLSIEKATSKALDPNFYANSML